MFIQFFRYRQPPSHIYPVSLNDCRNVTWSTLAGKSWLPIHPRYVIIGGDEAGGNMAAALALEFRSKIYMQILLNPKLQMFDFLTPSYQDHKNILTGVTSSARSAVDWLRYTGSSVSWYPALINNAHRFPSSEILQHQSYLDADTFLPSYLELTKSKTVTTKDYDSTIGKELKDLITSESLCPALASNTKGVPNAYIVTSQFDVHRDEAVMYITRLHKDSGSKVKLKHYKQAFQGFFPFAGNKSWFRFNVSDQALQELVEFISFQVHRVMKNPASWWLKLNKTLNKPSIFFVPYLSYQFFSSLNAFILPLQILERFIKCNDVWNSNLSVYIHWRTTHFHMNKKF